MPTEQEYREILKDWISTFLIAEGFDEIYTTDINRMTISRAGQHRGKLVRFTIDFIPIDRQTVFKSFGLNFFPDRQTYTSFKMEYSAELRAPELTDHHQADLIMDKLWNELESISYILTD